MDSRERLRARDLEGLRTVLNDWDPIGVYGAATPDEVSLPEWPADEYDCLRWPLVSRLRRGASRGELAVFLQAELREHFGMDDRVSDDDPVIERLLDWWKSTGVS